MKKIVLITGASGNLGKAVVEKFLAAEYKVVATVSPGKKLGYETKGDIEIVEADLTDEKKIESVVAEIVASNGWINAALLLVGSYSGGNISNTNGETLKKMYAVNFETAYFAARPVFLQMQKQPSGGRIVFIGSRPTLVPNDGKKSLAYSLSKSLLFKLAEYLNAEGAANNVVTSVIVPSTIDTPPNRQSMPSADFSKWVKPEEIADAIIYLTEAGQVLRETVLKIYGKA